MYNLKNGTINNSGLFRDTSAQILDGQLQFIDNINLDIQPYDRSLSSETSYKVSTNYKIYCDKKDSIDINCFFYTSDKELFKVLNLKEYPEFIVALCYKCENIVVTKEDSNARRI